MIYNFTYKLHKRRVQTVNFSPMEKQKSFNLYRQIVMILTTHQIIRMGLLITYHVDENSRNEIEVNNFVQLKLICSLMHFIFLVFNAL